MARKKILAIEERVMQIVIDQTAPGAGFKKDWKLVEDCGADSLDLIEIIMAVEDEFGIEIPDEDAERMVTVEDIVNYVDGALTRRNKR